MRIRSAVATDIGNVRTKQEDSVLEDPDHNLYAVADGMGGHRGGEVASKIAVETLMTGRHALNFKGIDDFFKQAFQVAHEKIIRSGQKHPERFGMGTTLTACAVVGETLHVAHAGDSALFLVRDGRSKQITTDQNLGASNPSVDKSYRNILANCLGCTPDAYHGCELTSFDLKVGDMVVLATDGLTRYKKFPLVTPYTGPLSSEAVANDLVDYALYCGGEDNVTVVALEVLS